VIIEVVQCDYCNTKQPMHGGMVPEEWLRFDGRHYCTRSCFTADELVA